MKIEHSFYVGVFKKLLWVAPTILLWAGCGKPTTTNSALVASNTVRQLPEITNAQPRLQTIKLWLGPHELEAELALKPDQMRTGMMFRTNLDEMSGMLFVYPYPMQVDFWMKNTTVPLDVGYMDAEGVLQEIYPLEPLNTNTVESKSESIQYVLEVNQGWFDRHNVSTGALATTEFGPLRKVFTPRR